MYVPNLIRPGIYNQIRSGEGVCDLSITVKSEQMVKVSPDQVYYAFTHAIVLHEWLRGLEPKCLIHLDASKDDPTYQSALPVLQVQLSEPV